MNKLNCFIVLLLLSQLNSLAQNFWEQTNGPFGGSVYSVAINSQSTTFAGTSSGLFFSINTGESWEKISNISFGVRYICIDNNDVIYITPVSESREHYSLFCSYDNGTSWERLGNDEQMFGKVIVSNSNDIFSLNQNHSNGGGLLRSIDGGESWDILSSNYFYDIAINSRGDLFGVGMNGVYRSLDSGENWQQLIQEYSDLRSVFIDDNDYIFVGSYKTITQSKDNGENWSTCLTDTSENVIYFINFSSYLGNITCNDYPWSNIFFSTNKGESWEIISKVLPLNIDIFTLQFDFEGNLFAGTDGKGIYKTTNNGTFWNVSNDGIKSTNISSICLDDNRNIYAAAGKAGVFMSTDIGDTWINISDTGNKNWLAILSCPNNQLYALYEPESDWRTTLARSSDYGLNWSIVDSVNHFEKIYFKNNSELFATVDSIFNTYSFIFHSTDNGATWNKRITLPKINDIGFDEDNRIYVATIDGIYLLNYEASNWHINKTLWNDAASNIEINSLGYLFIKNYDRIYYSKNKGISWNSTGYSSIDFFNVDPSNLLWGIQTWNHGIIYSTDYGNSWKYSGLSDSEVNTIAHDSEGNHFAGTSNQGILKCLYKGLTGIQEKQTHLNSFSLSQNYPNPFNPTTKIKYQIPHAGFVTLKVYDLLGREVATLVNEKKPSGSYEVEFNGNSLSSGIYFYKYKQNIILLLRR